MSDNRDLAFVAIGSNLGDSANIVLRAMDRLQEMSSCPLLRSSLWATSPVDCPPGSPVFVNATVGFLPAPEETPLSLLRKLQALEREFGRQPKRQSNEPRPLDLDLLAFSDQVAASPELTLPHPRAHLRRFVLAPLNEIAPDLFLPGASRTVADLLAALPSEDSVERLRPHQQ